MSRILIVDDEESICWALDRLLRTAGHDVVLGASVEEALNIVAHAPPDVIMLDVRLPGRDGLSAMHELHRLAPDAQIVVMTAFGNLETAVAAVRGGACDYLTKPFDLDRVTTVIDRALEQQPAAPRALADELLSSDELVGRSPAMQEVYKRIALVAASDASVLITGESGTGKELVARAIHRHSSRTARPLLPVNLAALSPSLIESELFGHVRGAFTGADVSRQGLLELADQGTVFLDEVGDIPTSVQVKLLRVLEQQELTPVGDTKSRPTSLRVISATNRSLRQLVQEGSFRQDLFFRLAVFEIALPSLRERIEDIPLLVQRFLGQGAHKASPPELTPAALAALCRRPWPGNVRELRNAVEHGALLARGRPIGPEHLPRASDEPGVTEGELTAAVRRWAQQELEASQSIADLYERFLRQVEPPLLETVLQSTDQNRAAAADVLGIHRATLRKKLQ